MHLHEGRILFSATDLANHLSCRHLTQLDILRVEGKLTPPHFDDADLKALIERGILHEEAYLGRLKDGGRTVAKLPDNHDWEAAAERTIAMMNDGVDVIAQGSLVKLPWRGRADVLLRAAGDSELGDWHYEVIDTKLSLRTKAETILQLCLYAQILEDIQGRLPERIGVVTPKSDDPEWYRTLDMISYFNRIQSGLERAERERPDTYPEPVEKCDLCRWKPLCKKRWKDDDHLSLVAGITRSQRRVLEENDVTTMEQLAHVLLPIPFDIKKGSKESLRKVREQARVQVEGRRQNRLIHELKPQEHGMGLFRLPEPSRGDVFLDLEGAPFVGDRGLEYLFGITYLDEAGDPAYEGRWALDHTEERSVFEWAVDFIEGRRKAHPDMHIYHYATYEESAFKRLMGWHNSRIDVIDDWLRNHLFVDLYRVVREGIVASVEKYSIKDLEPFFGYERKVDLRRAGDTRAQLERMLEMGQTDAAGPETLDAVLGYNRDDCDATLALRNWLEQLRDENDITERHGIPEEAIHTPGELRQLLDGTAKHLLEGLPEDPSLRSEDEQAVWLLAHCLGYPTRELKSEWWDFFRLRDLPKDDYMEEDHALAELEFVETVGQTDQKTPNPIDRYRFPSQECKIKEGDSVSTHEDKNVGTVRNIDLASCTVDIVKTRNSKDLHPTGIVLKERPVKKDHFTQSLLNLARAVQESGLNPTNLGGPAFDLLLRRRPRLNEGVFNWPRDTQDTVAETVKVVNLLDGSVLPIQGPPGAGKTYLASHLIVDLVRRGNKVGVAAQSHEVVLKVLCDVQKAAAASNFGVSLAHKGDKDKHTGRQIEIITDNDAAFQAIGSNLDVLGGTTFLWARPEAKDSVDVLLVDEASQVALADTLAICQAAKNVILVGDPAQLDKPQEGTHPEGVAVSGLQHLLGDAQVMPADRGIFLSRTYRMHPELTKFTSKAFYDSKLISSDAPKRQDFEGWVGVDRPWSYFVCVDSVGDQSSSEAEAQCVAWIAEKLIGEAFFTDNEGSRRKLSQSDILIITPFNAQVDLLREKLPGIRVGTVDKFQGQEAPVAIYSMVCSSAEDAPRGMDFLYNLNRLNVATSRAMVVSIVVANPQLMDVYCRSPHQIRLVNALCLFNDMSEAPRCMGEALPYEPTDDLP